MPYLCKIPSKYCKPQWLLIYFWLFIWTLRGKGSFCHFNSFVNVFMNAISTSFTLLCFWIPLRYGLCQLLSPRRGEASCSTPLSCVAEHWQTQFAGGEHEMTWCSRCCCDMDKWPLLFQARHHLSWGSASVHRWVKEKQGWFTWQEINLLQLVVKWKYLII